MYSFMLLNIARLFTKFKLVHDLCSCSTLFFGLCETFLFDGINDCEIHIPDLTVIRCDRFSREGDGVCIYLRNSISFHALQRILKKYHKKFIHMLCHSPPT